MESQKLDEQLNLALNTSPTEREKSVDLSVGYDPSLNSWQLILRYVGDISFLRERFGAKVTTLLNGYAVVELQEQFISDLIALEEVIYVEKPNNLFLAVTEGKRTSCLNPLYQPPFFLRGNGVIVAIIDSGIDYAHPDFRKEDGSSRILAIWDQTAIAREGEAPPDGYAIGVLYSKAQVDEALENVRSQQQLAVVPEVDLSGHGTFVAGVAAGNGRASSGVNAGVAPESDLLVVKLGNPQKGGFPRTTELMLGIDFVVRYAIAHQRPVAINLSFGNNYGSHEGTSLLETYMDSAMDSYQVVIAVGSGNEGDSGRHAGGKLFPGVRNDILFSIAPGEMSVNLQIWKQYVDDFTISLMAPNAQVLGPFVQTLGAARYRIMDTQIDLFYGYPKPYQSKQEIFISMTGTGLFVDSGEWRVILTPVKIVTGEYDLWLPVVGSVSRNTRFLLPDLEKSLTIPSTSSGAITVGAYDSKRDVIAPFSGRGFTGLFVTKPEVIAPGVDITSCAPGGGYTVKSGTSMATPFVTGTAALLMEWGIVKRNDPYLYGQKMKAYLIKGARHLPAYRDWPNPQAGWGALCVSESLPKR